MLDVSARDRRVLACGALAVAAIAAFGRGLPAARAWNAALVDSAASLAVDLASAGLAHRRVQLTRASLASVQARLASVDSSILIAPSPTAGAARLASLIADAADSSRVKLIATQLRADSARAVSLARVSVRITALADVAGLLAFLRALEENDVLMAVEELAISPSDPAAADDRPEVLRVEVVVAGLTHAQSSKL